MRRRLQIAIDCADPERLAGFWSAVLDDELLEGLGATRIRTRDEDGDFYIVMHDPEGNELCIA